MYDRTSSTPLKEGYICVCRYSRRPRYTRTLRSIEEDSEFAQDLRKFIEDVKKLPAKYFEGKYTRPVYLNEFAAAVVPNNISPSTTSYFVEANIPIYTYNPSVEGPRKDAILQAGEDVDDVRFRITSEMEDIKAKAIADGTFMLAPNGERTKLTERQWLQVRTEAFKKWFGDWELANLYNRAILAWNNANSKDKVVFGLSDKAKLRFNELLGKDIKQLIITDDAIRHIKKKHGNNEELRGQKNLSPEDIIVIPYLVNNFDSMELDATYNDNKGNRAITIKKRINGVSVVATIERGKNKEFLVTSYQFIKSDALDASQETPGRNVRNDSDIAKVQKDIETIKEKAKNSSKVVDANGEPKVVYHGTIVPNKRFFTFNTETPAWFSSYKGYAEAFQQGRDGKKTMYQTFLNAKNPLFVGNIDSIANNDNLLNLSKISNIPVEKLKEILKESGGINLFNVTNSVEFKELIQAQGYDGIEAIEGKVQSFAVFSPNQIKSATDNVGTFDSNNDDIRFRIQAEIQKPIFVSNAQLALDKIKQDKATPQQWLAMLEKNAGIKAGEDKWLGLSDWLKENTSKSITKQEIAEYIAENSIVIEEVWYGDNTEIIDANLAEFNREFSEFYDETDNELDSNERADLAFDEMINKYGDDFGWGFEVISSGYGFKLSPTNGFAGITYSR